jgi:hypothetical protein
MFIIIRGFNKHSYSREKVNMNIFSEDEEVRWGLREAKNHLMPPPHKFNFDVMNNFSQNWVISLVFHRRKKKNKLF